MEGSGPLDLADQHRGEAEPISTGPMAVSCNCSICLEPFNQPKILPCLHTFCSACLEKLGELKENNTTDQPSVARVEEKGCIELGVMPRSMQEIKCPLCKSVHSTQVELLPTDYSLQREVEKVAHSGTNGCKDARKATCGLCDDDRAPTAIGYCPQCRSFACQSCYEAHRRMKAFKSHSVVSMADFNPQQQLLSANIFCSDHKEELLNRYCGTCGVSACRECPLEKHYSSASVIATICISHIAWENMPYS